MGLPDGSAGRVLSGGRGRLYRCGSSLACLVLYAGPSRRGGGGSNLLSHVTDFLLLFGVAVRGELLRMDFVFGGASGSGLLAA